MHYFYLFFDIWYSPFPHWGNAAETTPGGKALSPPNGVFYPKEARPL